MALFCSACGKIVNGKYCRHCGQEVDKDTKSLETENHLLSLSFIRTRLMTEYQNTQRERKMIRRKKSRW